jgi:electron transport complex protein RnfA
MRRSSLLMAAALLMVMTLWLPAFADTGSGSFKKDKAIEINFGVPVDEAWAKNTANYTVFEETDPDIRVAVDSVVIGADKTSVTLNFKEALNTSGTYVVEAKDVTSEGKVLGARQFQVKKSNFQVLFGLIMAAALINNFVFTKFLGLCIFFGVSQKKETAIGMGFTFTTVMLLSATFCWLLYTFVLQALHLAFLQVIVFIGTVAIFVQAADTILRKVNPFLFKKLGVYLVLIVTNCIILAVPLENAIKGYGFASSLIYGLGAGLGFALAMFLMASVREKLELARVPAVFKGLPIAFIVTGLFALAFMGFSALVIF